VFLKAYHGIDVFRFYFRCTRCSQELTIKTDPENSDYVAELNCTRNFDMRKEEAADVADQKKQRKEEEELDAMKQLENRTMDSRMEMEILDALDEIKSLNARQQRLDTTDLLAMVEIQHDEEEAARKNLEELDGLEDRDLEELKALEDRGGIYIRRTYDHEEEDRFEKLHAKIMEAQQKKKELEAAHKFKAPVPRLAPRKSAAADKKIHDSLVVLVNNNEAVEKKPVASLLAIDDEEDEESGGLVSYGGADD
jgi:hypothetical protein